jgi:hypothetical protein
VNFAPVDAPLRSWAARNRLSLLTKHKDEEARSFEFVGTGLHSGLSGSASRGQEVFDVAVRVIGRPSRKSTRGSANRSQRDRNLQRRQRRRVSSPKARALAIKHK